MKLSEIVKILNSTIKTDSQQNIEWLLTDSRTLSFPEESLFFALKTGRNDGQKYIKELYEHGVRAFVVNALPDAAGEMPEAVFIPVENSLSTLQQLVASYRLKFNIPVIGITGSNGKTIVKEWLYQLLNDDYRIVRSPRSYNSQIGVPLSVWALNEQSEMGIFEAGISQVNEMEHLAPIIRPTIGVFTNLGEAHQAGFEGLKQKATEKIKLFEAAEVLIYNSDDKLVDISVAQANLKAELFRWGSKPTDQVQILSIDKRAVTAIQLRYRDETHRFEIAFQDDASIENAIQCICVLFYLKFDAVTIASKLLRLEPVAMRLEVKEGVRNNLIINDTYNSDLNSLAIALNFQEQQHYKTNLQRTVILSDIFQSGMDSEALYAQVAEWIHSKNIDCFVGVGEELSRFADLFQTPTKLFFKTTTTLLHSDFLRELKSSLVLLKAARSFQFEDVLSHLEAIVHETTLDVNLRAFINNFNYFRSKLEPQTKVMSVVKAYGYGSGAIEISRALQNNRCDYLAVAVADEGAELRREGIRLPIVVMNPEKAAFNTLIQNKLEPEIYSFRLLKLFMEAVEKEALSDYPVHIKIDTGMHRLGFNPVDVDELLTILKNQSRVKVRSIFTHLVGAEDAHFDDFTLHQIELFKASADKISNEFSHKILRHALNSAGIERLPEHQFDMVRLGIGLYNVSVLPDVQLETVSTLKTVILQIRAVKAGETVGYDRVGKLNRDSRIGVIPVGYADGLSRHLSNGVGEVWVNAKRAPIVGNVCMDTCMIDLTDVQANEGDVVEVFGEHITIHEMAEKLQTIPYEILTGISRRVKRVYFLD